MPEDAPEVAHASIRLAWPALQRLRKLGGDPAPILAAAGLDPHAIGDPELRIAEAVLDLVWHGCADAARDEGFGLDAGLDPLPGDMGVVEYVVRNAATLGEALETGLRYQRLLHDGAADRIEIDGDRATFVIALASGHEHAGALVDYGFARAMVTTMLLTGVPPRPIEVRFVHPAPRDARRWERTFHCPLVFGADRNTFVFRRERLGARIMGSDPGLLPVLEQHALTLLARIAQGSAGLVAKVSEKITMELTGGTPSIEAIAESLHMSSRTLARRLADEGTSFSQLLDDLRRELAVAYLRDRAMSVSEVAFLLGFTDTNAFSRAFKRWTGQPPSQLKRASQPPRP